ncbi:RNA polymerase sigma factor [Hansschlegelia zhihuaiae]|uniref:Sigma-70 family RNA polymerase sigma factor n=1 Tax=Hansschlegelia zhihuaiae TaxID=405005 RepID=A0A4Q0MCG1_9HYPH|nr:sigma-70 family RNA polymerase sigma factor [Hansschlegelia zhihuaiae]RXF70885.1 sigma-70 family RNA polymerase sigma factor [Hansschlegelia zhihuaiae]
MQDMIVLVEPLIPALRRYARSLLREPAAADDLVQDCLERAITRWGQRRSDCDVRSWLFAILHNLAINQMRQAARRGVHVAIEDSDETAFSRAPTQEDGIRHRDIHDALEALPEEQRSVILLVSVEGLSYADTAKVLGVPIGTVMSRLSRGRERLQRSLDTGVVVKTPNLRRVK